MIRPVAAAVLALLLIQLTSCAGGTTAVRGTAVVSGSTDPYWGGPVFSYNVGYFWGPPVVVYPGWGPNYFVAPPRWGTHPRGWGRPPPVRHPAFRPPPPGRPMPSVPNRPRGPAMRGATVRP